MDSEYKPARRPPRRLLIELMVGLTALIVSVVSLFIAVRQTQVMDKQLAASVWPALQYYTSNMRNGEPVITMSIENVGIGPARIRSFSVWRNGVRIDDPNALMRECCATNGESFNTIHSFVTGRIMRPGQEVTFLTLPFDSLQPHIFERFNRTRNEIEARICFCSVLDDCWQFSSTSQTEPKSVSTCPVEPNT
jgi:hypothetical protein